MKMNSINEKAVQALLYGHSCAMRLKLRLDDPMADSGPVSSYDLASSIVDCFSNAISILNLIPKSEHDQISDLSSRDSSPLPPQKSHSKKRKIDNIESSENWRDDSPNPTYYDGFLWRKYGQKCIKKSDHQRSYYRCSYNKDHNCPARKHEQKIKDNPPVYRTTYFGQHTCNANHNQAAIHTGLHDPVDDLNSVRMIRFGNDLDQNQNQKESNSSGASLSVKDEKDINMIKEETMDESSETSGDDQGDFQHVKEENEPSPSGSSGCESFEFDSDLLFDSIDLWARYDQFDFGLVDFSAS